MKIKLRILLLIAFLVKAGSLSAQNVDYAVHANIIYRFTKYVEWPAEAKPGEFVIGCIGDSPLFDLLLVSTQNKTAKGRKIIIKKFTGTEPSYSCEILIISEEESRWLKRIVAVTLHSPVLIVTESEGLVRKGSCINFLVEDDHLTLEFNKHNLEERKLNVASELMSFGKVID